MRILQHGMLKNSREGMTERTKKDPGQVIDIAEEITGHNEEVEQEAEKTRGFLRRDGFTKDGPSRVIDSELRVAESYSRGIG